MGIQKTFSEVTENSKHGRVYIPILFLIQCKKEIFLRELNRQKEDRYEVKNREDSLCSKEDKRNLV